MRMKTSSANRALRPSSVAKREAILDAAQVEFLAHGYERVTMDAIARRSGVAKQTLYGHFGAKEALFLELVRSQTRAATERVHRKEASGDEGAREQLERVLIQQLQTVLAPNLLALRRLVIGLMAQFPELARELYEQGAQQAIRALAQRLEALTSAGELAVNDPARAATQLNWLVMGEPVNRAMLLGDAAALGDRTVEEHVTAALDVFLAAYGVASDSVSTQ